ncbi:MAG: ABC transporter permease [Defluviitaleaceae bacterium]|nr:ABC transporter permease [Defluviitaleaceae bacterium]
MIFFIMQQTMFFFIPLLIVALGGMFSERSGIVNIALEGIMVMGAFTSILFISTFQHMMPGQTTLLLGLLIAMATGVFVACFHAYACINLNANQTISGIAINIFAPAFAIYTARIVGQTQQVFFAPQMFLISSVPILGEIPIIGPSFFQGAYITTYIGIGVLVVSWFVLYKTRFGLRLRSCGEHPQAADSVGINVYRIRWAAVLISGALAGMGGLVLIVPTSIAFNATVSGYGFLAIAVLIFGQWKPLRIILAAFFFGLMQAITASHTVIGFLRDIAIPAHFYHMTPYIATLVLLAFTSKRSAAPRALGQPYEKGLR